jgi:hypothetical protein
VFVGQAAEELSAREAEFVPLGPGEVLLGAFAEERF